LTAVLSARAEHGNDIARASPAIPKAIERRDASTHQRCRLHG
jgi:hypothetical protein